MSLKQIVNRHKCYGAMTVGPRGQVVIPASARREMGIESGDTMLVFKGFGVNQALTMIKADNIEDMLDSISEGLAAFEKMLKDYRDYRLQKADPEGGQQT